MCVRAGGAGKRSCCIARQAHQHTYEGRFDRSRPCMRRNAWVAAELTPDADQDKVADRTALPKHPTRRNQHVTLCCTAAIPTRFETFVNQARIWLQRTDAPMVHLGLHMQNCCSNSVTPTVPGAVTHTSSTLNSFQQIQKTPKDLHQPEGRTHTALAPSTTGSHKMPVLLTGPLPSRIT